jgi:glycosyltransferase involved in cell wall biosynthesis
MNVLLTNATDIFAGGEDYVLILARYLARRGHTVWVSARPGHLLLRKCDEASIPTIPLAYGDMGRVFSVSGMLRSAMHTRAIRVVHSNANYDRTCAAIASSFTPIRHVAGVHSAHSIQHNITHWLRNRYGTDHFITDADAGKEVLVRQDRIPAARITTVPIGIECDETHVRSRFRDKVRAALGIKPGTVVIGNVARLVPFKGHRHLLDAMAGVIRSAGDVLLLIAGDGELDSDLRAQAASLGISSHVRFLGFRDDLDELYPAFDIYCHSSVEMASEMFPIAILRALASALPVVCTRVGGIDAMVEQDVTGHLTPPEDPHALAAALLDLITSDTKRRHMGDASFRLFEQRYHASAMAERVEQVYDRTFSQHRQVP